MTTKEEILAIAGKPTEFKRENKYLVLKWGDITNFLTDDQQLKLDALITKIRVRRLRQGKYDQSYVCIAADWPMYEQVWSMVEAFVDGKPSQMDELRQQLAEKDAEIERLKEEVRVTKEEDFPRKVKAVANNWQNKFAAAQAREQQYREALHYSLGAWHYDGVSDEHGSIFKEANNRCDRPSDTSALEAMIAKAGEVMRERCAMQFAVFKWRDTAKELISALPGVTLADLKGAE